MTSYVKTDPTDFVKPNFENEIEFSQVVKDGRRILEIEVEYQTEKWDWTGDLDDAGIFIFSYLLHDYKKKILSLRRLKESVNTLNLLRKIEHIRNFARKSRNCIGPLRSIKYV